MSISNLFKIKVVHLSGLSKQLKNPQVLEYFSKMIDMKFSGYKSYYQKKMGHLPLPVDRYDYFCDHIGVFLETKDGLEIINAYRSTSKSQCDEYGQEFTGYDLLRELNAPERFFQMMDKHINKAEELEHEIAYEEKWSANQEMKSNGRIPHNIKEILMAVCYFHHRDFNIGQCYTGGATALHTDTFFQEFGYEQQLETLKHGYYNTDIKIMWKNAFSEHCIEVASKYEDIWDNRIDLTIPVGKSEKKAS